MERYIGLDGHSQSCTLAVWRLAEDLRAGAIRRRVYKGLGPYSELRAAVRSYGQLRTDVRRVKSRLKAIYRSRGLLPGNDVLQETKHRTWDRQLPPAQGRSSEMLRAQVESLTA